MGENTFAESVCSLRKSCPKNGKTKMNLIFLVSSFLLPFILFSISLPLFIGLSATGLFALSRLGLCFNFQIPFGLTLSTITYNKENGIKAIHKISRSNNVLAQHLFERKGLLVREIMNPGWRSIGWRAVRSWPDTLRLWISGNEIDPVVV